MSPKILSIDPGRTTGFSINYAANRNQSVPQFHSWQVDFFLGQPPHEALYHTLWRADPEVIVCESFDYRQAKLGLDTTPAEFIGVVKLYCQHQEIKLVEQNPSVKSKDGFWTDRKLKYLGLYLPGFGHAMDALRHRLHYEEKVGLFDMSVFNDLR